MGWRHLVPRSLAAAGLLLLAADLGGEEPPTPAPPAPVLRLDHVPIAVRDLEAARITFRDRLGFSLEPGHLHPNGVENVHLKLADGTALELITAHRRSDVQASAYLDLLAKGEQAAHLALDAGPVAPLGPRLRPLGHKTFLKLGRPIETLTFPDDDPLHTFFFVDVESRPPDLPEHLAHRNGALGLAAVWLAADAFDDELRLFELLGAPPPEAVRIAGLDVAGRALRLARGSVYLLPRAPFAALPGRIVGVTIRVRDLAATREALGPLAAEAKVDAGGASLLVRPEAAHGVWIELRGPAAP